MNLNKNKTYRTIFINMPKELRPVYNKLQHLLNSLLSNKHTRHYILNKVDYTQHKGMVWKQVKQDLNTHIQLELGPDFPNVAWYSYMVIEQIRRLYFSLQEKVKIYEVAKTHNFVISADLRSELASKSLYPTSGNLRNLCRSRKAPELPKKATFEMDYSVSARQNCYWVNDSKNKIRLKYGKTSNQWVELDLYLPLSVRESNTGDFAKPMFFKDKNGQYKGALSYEIEVPENEFDNILGVDIGKIKPYSATMLYGDNSLSQEYTPSRYLLHLMDKLNTLYQERYFIYDKQHKVSPYLRGARTLKSTIDKYDRRMAAIGYISSKIEHLKVEIAKQIANEVVSIATNTQCKEIHIENLAWLDSKGGKWNHAEIQKWIENTAEVYGIKVLKVNAANTSKQHPVTGEIGRISGRDVVFSNGERIDRDKLGGINIACRSKNLARKPSKINRQSNKSHKNENKRKIREKVKLNLQKRDTEIVVYSTVEPSLDEYGLLVLKVQPNSYMQKQHRPRCCNCI